MAPSPEERGSTGQRAIVVSRLLAAPQERVWAAWTDPEQIVEWWGPHGFTTTIHEMDIRPGGAWRHTIHGPDGTDYPNEIRFIEVIEPRRIVYAHAGGPGGEPHGGFVGTWSFEAEGPRTRLTMRLEFESPQDRDLAVERGALSGATETLARLWEVLAHGGAADGTSTR